MTKLLHIKIHINKNKVNALFYSSQEVNLIKEDLVSKLGLEILDHPYAFSLGWVNKDVELKVTKHVSLYLLLVEMLLMDQKSMLYFFMALTQVFCNPYMYIRSHFFMRRETNIALLNKVNILASMHIQVIMRSLQ